MSTVCYSEKLFSGNYLRFNIFSLKKRKNYKYPENTVTYPFIKVPLLSEIYMFVMRGTYLFVVNQ